MSCKIFCHITYIVRGLTISMSANTLEELELSWKLFLDKSTVLYGESGTGKSVIIVDILYHLKPYVEQCFVIAPSDRKNHTYSGGVVPLPCIHYRITEKFLNDLWKRQEALGAVYSKANQADVLKKLFDRLNLSNVNSMIRDVESKRKDREREIYETYPDPETAKDKVEDMMKEFNKLMVLIYKQYVNENRAKLMKMNLTQDELFSLKYINLNPRLVLIFDDCSAQLKQFKSHPIVQELFYQGRHAFITPIIACHTDKNLDAELRKNAFVTIFTEETCAHAFFHRGSNDLDKAAKTRADAACKATFTPTSKHQKLAWIRDEKKFYRFTATRRTGFSFGSPHIWDFCKMIANDGMSFSDDNQFMTEFLK